MTDSIITQTANALMRAVVASRAIRAGSVHHEADVTLACTVMREELKDFLGVAGEPSKKYEDERQLALTGVTGLAMASLVAECIRRIVAERAN